MPVVVPPSRPNQHGSSSGGETFDSFDGKCYGLNLPFCFSANLGWGSQQELDNESFASK